MKAYLQYISITIVMLPLLLVAQPTNSESKTRFVCGKVQGIPATLAILPSGTQAPIIRYASSAFAGSGFSNHKRCEEISMRFQYFNDRGELDFITVGKINGQNVICVTRQIGGGCSRDLKSEGLLLTVRPGINPKTVLTQLFKASMRTGPIYESEETPYVNIRCLIDAGKNQEAYDSCVKRKSRLSAPPSNVNQSSCYLNEITNSTSCSIPSKDINSDPSFSERPYLW
jgi:hypothetical protein